MNLIEPGLAFIEGLALIASPCILPVLPLVLSASADGGKKRPFGIITGFVLAFSLFAIASRKLIEALGIDWFGVDALRGPDFGRGVGASHSPAIRFARHIHYFIVCDWRGLADVGDRLNGAEDFK